MSNDATDQAPDTISGGFAMGRRFNIGGMPAAPTALWLLALLLVLAAVASSWQTINAGRLALRAAGMPGGPVDGVAVLLALLRSEEHTSELQSLMRISYAVFCLKK